MTFTAKTVEVAKIFCIIFSGKFCCRLVQSRKFSPKTQYTTFEVWRSICKKFAIGSYKKKQHNPTKKLFKNLFWKSFKFKSADLNLKLPPKKTKKFWLMDIDMRCLILFKSRNFLFRKWNCMWPFKSSFYLTLVIVRETSHVHN